MQYTRDFIPLKECISGYGRGGMIPHGIARIEKNQEMVKLRINLYGLAPAAGPYTAYTINVTDSTYHRMELGQLQPDALGRCELGYRNAAAKEDTERIGVVAIALADGTEVLNGYADGMVDWSSLRNADADAPEKEEDTAEAEKEETEIHEEPVRCEEIPEAADSAENVSGSAEDTSAARDALQYMLTAYPKIFPFREATERWIRIHPRDIAPLPVDVVSLESSPFLQRGYLQYKHLILGYEENVYYLGVPFRYSQEQEEIAHNWGFMEFRNSFGTVPMKNDYGYWLRRMEF